MLLARPPGVARVRCFKGTTITAQGAAVYAYKPSSSIFLSNGANCIEIR